MAPRTSATDNKNKGKRTTLSNTSKIGRLIRLTTRDKDKVQDAAVLKVASLQ